MRRATEREGRRARRRRARELAPVLPRHMDGMSSDDEVTEQQNLVFRQIRGIFFSMKINCIFVFIDNFILKDRLHPLGHEFY